MTGNHGGRHRAPKPSRSVSAVVALALVGSLVAAGSAAIWITQRDDSPADPSVTTTQPTHAASVVPAVVETSRVVKVKGVRVTVRESMSVKEGGPVTVGPSKRSPAVGLRASRAVVLGENGTHTPFTKPTSLPAGRTITIEGHYRLERCPDLLPAEWPDPVTLVPGDWSHTFTKVDEPQRTSRALCPKAQSKAMQTRKLRGSMVAGKEPVVRLTWSAKGPAAVVAVGSASGVAARGVGPRCPGCIARLNKQSAARIELRPLEPCPVGGKTNLLTMKLVVGKGKPRIVGVNVAGLGAAICR